MITDFKALTIPEGEVVKIEDSQGRVLWTKPSALPYDAEVEYLYGDFSQHILTGIVPTEDTGIRVGITKVIDTDIYIVGLRDNSPSNARWCIGQTVGRYYYGYGGYSSQVTNTDANVVLDLNYYNDNKFCVRNFNTFVATDELPLPTLSFTPQNEIRIFGSSGIAANYSRWRGNIHFVQITQGSTLAMDLIPVRVGTTGYMYDKVSKQLFGNAGTGAFGLGPDK